MTPKLVEDIQGCVKFAPHTEGDVAGTVAYISYPLKLDSPIYRYMSVERYLDLVENGVNSLSHFSLWEDPYEAYLIRAAISCCQRNGDVDNERELYEKYKFVYGQSWTLNENESDVLWRAFGRRGDVVRIKSTIRKLYNTFAENPSDIKTDESLKLRIRDVEYCDQEDLDRDMDYRKLVEDLDNDMDMFFRKRREFEDEHELRCVVVVMNDECLNKNKDVNGSLLKFEIKNIGDFIDEVLLDPCMSPCVREQVICRTLHRSSEIRIKQSDLFAWPEFGNAKVDPAPDLKVGFAPSVREKLIPVLESDKVTDDELNKLCTLEYSRETFKLVFPLLRTDVATAPVERYWKKPHEFHGRQYRVCNDWKESRNKRSFEDWLRGKHT